MSLIICFLELSEEFRSDLKKKKKKKKKVRISHGKRAIGIVDGYASLFNCTTAVRATDSMKTSS